MSSYLRTGRHFSNKKKLFDFLTKQVETASFPADRVVYITSGPGGGTPLYKVYRYVPPQRVWFLSRFGLKTGIDFNNYGLKWGRVFGAGTFTKAYKHIFLLST